MGQKQGCCPCFGHKNAIKAVRDVTEGCAELGVKFLTLYAFSTENWNRPKAEVNALMQLLVSTISAEVKTLMDNDISLATIGDTASLPAKAQRELAEAIEKTANNKRMKLVLALSYSGRWDIVNAVKNFAEKKQQEGDLNIDDVDQNLFESYLDTSGIPDPELLIRTSGEQRISNFLLWQMAYTEFFLSLTHCGRISGNSIYTKPLSPTNSGKGVLEK